MATIVNPRLAVSADRLHDRASISVSCDRPMTDLHRYEETSVEAVKHSDVVRVDLAA